MLSNNGQPRDGFSSKFGVIAAIAGSAVGLGNIWRFPYIAGENGGGAFLLLYFACVVAIGIPVMMSELIIGRRAQSNAYGSFRKLAPGSGWPVIGILGIVAAFVILSFYSTVAGWTLEYIVQAFSGGLNGKSNDELKTLFDGFISHPWRPLVWQMAFMFLTAFIVFFGVQKGIEKSSKILMPLLVILVVGLCIRSLTLPNSMEGLRFFLYPDFSKITWDVVLKAMGQAAFSLSIGMGALITYGSYIGKKNKLTGTAFQITITDTSIAVLSGLIVFPAIFSYGINPQEGPGLAFIVFPAIFAQMPAGVFFAIAFFVLLAVASLTSTISVLEVFVAFLHEETKLSRKGATIAGALSIALVGVFCTLSFGVMSDVKIFGKTIFDLFDYSSANILLPLGALLIVIFTGWFLGRKNVKDELTNGGALKGRLFLLFLFIIRFIAPVVIIIVFLKSLGLINF
jgi:NSS family neurotransmitter:Na+ symporter